MNQMFWEENKVPRGEEWQGPLNLVKQYETVLSFKLSLLI